MMKKFIMVGTILAAIVAFADAAFSVKNVTAQQRYPWNGKVDIVVTLQGDVSGVANYECTFVATNSATKAAVPVMAITQVGSDAVSGDVCTRRYLWNAATDVGAVKIDDLALTVDVDVKELGGVQLWENGPYWAECNVGATKPEEYGYYFWWGDTVGYKRNANDDGWVSVRDGSSFLFYEGNCPTYDKDSSSLQSQGYIDSTGNLVAAHDAATAHLGAPWRMPTDAETSALIINCDTSWTTRNGVVGRLVTGRGAFASKSIFLPAAGSGYGPYLYFAGSSGYVWSSTPRSDYSNCAWYLYFSSGYFYRHYNLRFYGQSVRPLRGASDVGLGLTTHLALDLDAGHVMISSLTAQQRYPWNGKVDIVVTLQGDVSEVANYECTFVATNCATLAAVSVVTISQVGSDAVSGDVCTRRYLWNAATDVGAVKIDDLALTVDVDVKELGGVQLWENGPYWAECNVGASKPEEYGYYFWWGDTVGYNRNASNDGWVSVKDGAFWSFSDCPTFGKDNTTLQSLGYIDSTGNLVPAHDAATVHLGAPWRMPTSAEIDALVNNCTTTWTTRNGVYGRLVSGKGDYASKSIFLPAAGYGSESGLCYTGSSGLYWSSTSNSDCSYYAWSLLSNINKRHYNLRFSGQSVRPLRGIAGFVTHLKLDCRTGARLVSADGETLYYDAAWYDNVASISIADNGTPIASGTKGTASWNPSVCGSHTLTLKAMSNSGLQAGSETAEFKLDHVEVVTKAEKEPTCMESGCTEEVCCTRCNAVLAISEAIPALGHIEVVTTAAKSATCTEGGHTKGSYCSRCNAVLATSTAISALGHSEVETMTAKAATCTEDGRTHEVTCSMCGTIVEKSTTLPKLGHVEVETKAAATATCTEAGCTKGSYCSRCHAILSTSAVVPALGHAEVITTRAKQETCTTDGRTKGSYCSRCGLVLSISQVIPHGHAGTITQPAVAATSSMAGRTAEIRCSRCNELLQAATEIPALGYVRNVTARQLWPHKKVEVRYELAEDICEVADTDDVIGLTNSAGHVARNVLGDRKCTPGIHRVVWDMEVDGIEVKAADMTFSVVVDGDTPGFVTKTFTGSAFDKTSDVWGGTTVESPSGLYATSLAEHTTVAYGCYMRMEQGVTYYFKGCFDDYVAVKVNGNWIMGNSTECQAASGSFTPTASGYYPVEFRAGNNGGPGGCQNSNQYGIRWRTSVNTTWRNIGNTAGETVFFTRMNVK